MRRLITIVAAILCTLSFTACVDEEEFDDTPTGNFEALWKIVYER